MKKRVKLIAVLGATLLITALSYYFLVILPSQIHRQARSTGKTDEFGILKIYPTAVGGREWFIDMENPLKDGLFNPHSNITEEEDGSWQISGRDTLGKYEDQVRMDVSTPPGQPEWKNVEITGYAKVITAKPPYDSLVWYARGIRHDSAFPCEGTSLKGGIDVDGTVSWKKEIWHTGGYTDARARAKVTDSLLDKWIGWKVVMYNINNDKAVKMESYLDYNSNNSWIKVTDIVDNGGWFANSPDSVFYSANCGYPKDYIVTNPGPIVTFRSDNMVWDFKNLSVREIDPQLASQAS
jgi:hypothetical protein